MPPRVFLGKKKISPTKPLSLSLTSSSSSSLLILVQSGGESTRESKRRGGSFFLKRELFTARGNESEIYLFQSPGGFEFGDFRERFFFASKSKKIRPKREPENRRTRGQKIFKRALKFFQKNRARAFFFSSSLVFC